MKLVAALLLIVLAAGCKDSASDAGAIRVGESVASARNKLSSWQAQSASERFAWSQAMPSDKLDSTELDQFEFRCRAENSFCDDPIFAWHTGERECVMCFTAKDELVTAISEVKPYGNWRHGLTSVRRDGHVE